MAKYSEETLKAWWSSAKEGEKKRASNAIQMIKSAVKSHSILAEYDIESIVQGSYANDTNIRTDSDVDISLVRKDLFYTVYPDGVSDSYYGFFSMPDPFPDYKKCVIRAMVSKFGSECVSVGNKSIKINSNGYHVQADVVPSMQYRDYRSLRSFNPDYFIEGIKFYSVDNQEVLNYPKAHVENGRAKNKKTHRRYKRTVRLYKKIRNKMIESGVPVPKAISSFLLECLLWNVPDKFFVSDFSGWNGILRDSICFLYEQTSNDSKCEDWGEVSEHLYLFRPERKWNVGLVNMFLKQMWNHLGL